MTGTMAAKRPLPWQFLTGEPGGPQRDGAGATWQEEEEEWEAAREA